MDGETHVAKMRRETKPRFDREAWLAAALEVLAKEGQARLKIERLAADLGVTKGSFYHHFANRDDFVDAVVEYWATAFTERVIQEVGVGKAPARQRLLRLMEAIRRDGLDRYDIAFRSWAAQDERVAEAVRKIDNERYRFVRGLFSEIGFEGAELEERVRVWLVFHSAQRTVYVPELCQSSETTRRLHAFFLQSGQGTFGERKGGTP